MNRILFLVLYVYEVTKKLDGHIWVAFFSRSTLFAVWDRFSRFSPTWS